MKATDSDRWNSVKLKCTAILLILGASTIVFSYYSTFELTLPNMQEIELHKINKTNLNLNITSPMMSLSTQLQINNTNTYNNTTPLHMLDQSKWFTCFKSISNASREVATTQHLLNRLIKEYIIPNKLKIFVPTYMRMPNIYEAKCQIPMTSFQISRDYYYIENEFYLRKFDRTLCLRLDFCLNYDWMFLWKYIIKNYKDNGLQWFLWLEDDVSLCPNMLHEIFYYVNNTLNSKSKYVLLGPGATGILINVDLVPTLLRIMKNYTPKMSRIYRGNHGSWFLGPDTYLKKKLGNKYLAIDINAIYHPAANETASTLKHDHAWVNPTQCGQRLGKKKK